MSSSQPQRDTSRRDFLKYAGATGLALGVAGCSGTTGGGDGGDGGDGSTEAPPEGLPEPKIVEKTDETYNAFTDFGGFKGHVKDGVLTRLSYYGKPYTNHPAGPAWRSRVYAPDRIKYPMKRKGWEPGGNGDTTGRGKGEYVRISWEEALDIYASELERIKSEHGNESFYCVGSYWDSDSSLHSCGNLLARMLNLYGGFTDRFSSYSSGCQTATLPYSIGQSFDPSNTWRDTLDNAEVVVFWGANPALSHAIGHKNEMSSFLQQLRDSDTKIYVIDPRYSQTAHVTRGEHIPIAPRTDVAMMAAMAYVMIDEGLYDEEFVEKYTVGFEPFEKYIMGEDDGEPKTPEWAAEETGIEASKIRSMAREFAEKRTTIGSAYSLQRGQYSEQDERMKWALASLIGDVGLHGGGVTRFLFGGGAPGVDFKGPGSIPVPSNPVDEFIPMAKIADMLLNPGEEYEFDGETKTYPDIRAVLLTSHNPWTAHQDLNRLLKAWEKPEFVAQSEIWWHPSARHADLVLPAASPLERNDIVASSTSVEAKPKMIDPLFESRTDFDAFTGVAERLGIDLQFTEGKSEMDWVRNFYETSDVPLSFEEFWEKQRYTFEGGTLEDQEAVPAFASFREDPEANPLGTPSGKIEIYSETLDGYGYEDCPPTPTYMPNDEYLGSPKAKKYPLHVMSPHVKHRLHSQFDNASFVRKWSKVNGKEPMWINPVDAKKRGIEDGDVVRVFNDRGETLAGAFVTERIRPSVIALSYGSWWEQETPGKAGSLFSVNGNVNAITQDNHTSSLAQGTAAKTCLGDVEKYGGE